MKFNQALNNFTSGEWSPKMVARSETDQYAKSCRKIQNAIVQMQGGAFKRPGFLYQEIVGDLFNSMQNATKVRLFPWSLSNGKRYVVFASETSPTGGVGSCPWYVFDTDDGTTHLIVGSPSTDVGDPYIDEAQFCQVADTLFIVSRGAPPRMLRLEGSNFSFRSYWEYWSTTLSGSQTGNAYPFETLNSAGVNGTITATGTFTVGGSVALVSSNPIFQPQMDDGDFYGLFLFTAGGVLGAASITAVTDTTHATATVIAALPGASPTTYGVNSGTGFAKAAWNGYSGWPRTITSHQGRLIFGGNIGFPDTVWGSRIGNVFQMFENFLATGYADDNSRAFTLTPSSKEASNILALSSAKVLTINTDRSEIVAYGSNGALGPNDLNFDSSTSFGAERVQPVRVNNYLTFVQRGGRKLRDLIFSFDENQYKSSDLAFVADHLTNGEPIVEMAAAEIGSSVLFSRTQLNNLLALTLDRDYQVNAWSEQILGGAYLQGTPQILCMCSVPKQENNLDGLFVLVKRTLNGASKVYLEKMGQFFDNDAIVPITGDIPVYLDSALRKISPVAALVHTGFNHLAATVVTVVADGNFIGTKLVTTGGEITLDVPARDVLVGLPYVMIVQPSPVEQGVQIGNPQGITKRVVEFFIRFFNTVGCKYGRIGELYDIEFRTSANPLNGPIPLFTGDKYLKFPPGYSRTFELAIYSDTPYPCNVLAIVLGGSAYD